MRHPYPFLPLLLVGGVLLSACAPSGEDQVEQAMRDAAALGDTNLGEMMLTVGNPAEAVNYFTRAVTAEPDSIEMKRGLATALVRANRAAESVSIWQHVVAHPQSGPEDGVNLADALIRNNQWAAAEAALNAVPPTHESFQRYRLEAMVADANEDWARADSFYEIAVGLTTTPAGVYNNWGFSKLSRGAYAEAERLFNDALRYEPGLFTAKNNLVMARGAQRRYDLPVISMTQTERAQLLYTMALAAIKQNDVNIGRGLLREAVDTHPQHFEEAARALRALEDNVTN